MSDSAPPKWPMLVYYGMSLVSLPLYLLVFVSFLRLRRVSKTYNSVFYSILLQHCIADLLAMVFFFATNPMRVLPYIRDFYFDYQQYYITAASYNSVYYFLALFYYIRQHTAGFSKSLRREVHLAIQVFVLLLAFFAILVYYGFQNYFSQSDDTKPIFYMRAMYPVANGLLSYINPFCILFLNRDLASQVFRTATCHRNITSDFQVSAIITTSTKHPMKRDASRDGQTLQ
ncbi:hypothetical protein L5515_010965 [Caenorhabditis briggsae]|uniref:Uncharacterized protein n=1 Tax=Caenorhabditis briggsae TaxID=6238 RepID=A0AAE9ENL3_CAEBR|nr:hypothetical protein L5515_010965 [Caenorhabditis briggsae]